MGLSCKFSPKPIHWIICNTHQYIGQIWIDLDRIVMYTLRTTHQSTIILSIFTSSWDFGIFHLQYSSIFPKNPIKSRSLWNLIDHLKLIGGLEHDFYDFPFSWEFHHPNWLSLIFFRGVGIPPTSIYIYIMGYEWNIYNGTYNGIKWNLIYSIINYIPLYIPYYT
jgi:hypothetical protein